MGTQITVTDKSVDCANPSPTKVGTKGIYTVITDIETGRSYAVRAFRMYMQQNVNDPNRPDGHMYVEFLIDTSQQFQTPHANIDQDVTMKMPAPCRSVWWRAMLNGKVKMSTFSEQVSFVSGTGQDAIFEQNIC